MNFLKFPGIIAVSFMENSNIWIFYIILPVSFYLWLHMAKNKYRECVVCLGYTNELAIVLEA